MLLQQILQRKESKNSHYLPELQIICYNENQSIEAEDFYRKQ